MKLPKFNPLLSPLLILIILIIFVILLITGYVSEIIFLSILVSAFITSLNFIVGYLSIKFALGKSVDSFIKILIGVMILRLFGMLISVFICLKFLELNGNSFIFSILFFYIFYLIIEILSLNLNKKK